MCDAPDSLAKYLMEWHLAFSAYAIQPRERRPLLNARLDWSAL